MSPLGRSLDKWLGRGEASITTPPLDGAFRPNDRLDLGDVAFAAPAPDGLALTSRGLVASSESSLFAVDQPGGAALATFDAEISALAALPDGGLAVGLVNGRIALVGGRRDGQSIAAHPDVKCITALVLARDGALLIANGSATNPPTAWKRDLMQKNVSGSVWRLDLATNAPTRLAGNLAYPYGLIEDADSIVVSESWRAALTRISNGGRRATVVESLPAYPSRMSLGSDGSIWLALFAPRSQLVEFVLSEARYRQRMMDEMEHDHWVAPCLRAGQSPLEPTQQGGVKQLGVLKPWSPNRSYGLIARLDRSYRPVASYHSRANGRRHGVTACLERDGRLYFAAKGDGIVASLALGGTSR